jgi:uncharacterized protein (TIGR02444 family)
MTDPKAKDTAAQNPLWDYSVAIYGRPGVEDACLALQDQAGADVGMMLFLCWIAQSGRGRMTRAEVQKAMAVVAVWRVQVLAPLRRVRRRVKANGTSGEPALHKKLLEVELDAERIEQVRLYTTMTRDPVTLHGTPETREADARYNCGLYFEEAGVPLGGPLGDALTTLIKAATRD